LILLAIKIDQKKLYLITNTAQYKKYDTVFLCIFLFFVEKSLKWPKDV
jgi:hypothetical protein